MKIEKKVIVNLTKCYSIAPLHYNNENHFLVASEKIDRCLLFDLNGNIEDTIWTQPGGVMTMVQIPDSNGQFLAIHKFYSPNDSKESKIVIITPIEKGKWDVRTLINLPHVHRFDILERNGSRYLIVCTLKSGHEYKDDWSMPGKVYSAVLPEDLSVFDEKHQLELKVIKDNMLKNHGYYKVNENGIQTGIISADCGVYQFIPPAEKGGTWEIIQLLTIPASDAVLIDMDYDGKKELIVLSPFHGDNVSIYKKSHEYFEKVYHYDKPIEFTHAIFGGILCEKSTVIIGHRKGSQDLLAFTFNMETKEYEVQIIDRNCGPANIYKYFYNGKDVIISANREIDEVAMYKLEP